MLLRRLILISVAIVIASARANADVFIAIPIKFGDFVHNSFPQEMGVVTKEDWLRAPCVGLDHASHGVAGFAALNKQAMQAAEGALMANDRESHARHLSRANGYLREEVAAKTLLRAVAALPVKASYTFLPRDPVGSFLISASLSRIDANFWLANLKGTSIRSALAVNSLRLREIGGATIPEYVELKFQKNDTPAALPIASQAPISIVVGSGICKLKRCEPSATRVVIDSKIGELCGALQAQGGRLLEFTLTYDSSGFGNDKVHTKFVLTDEKLTEAEEDGNNKAIDYLLKDFLIDILDPQQQLYRVSDRFNDFETRPHNHRDSRIAVRNLDGSKISYTVKRMRSAIEEMQGVIASDGGLSVSEISAALSTKGRYRGRVVDEFRGIDRADQSHYSGGRLTREMIEFSIATKTSSVLVGFTVRGAYIPLAPSVVLNGEIFTVSRPVSLAYIYAGREQYPGSNLIYFYRGLACAHSWPDRTCDNND